MALGRVGIVMSDSRFCRGDEVGQEQRLCGRPVSADAFWWVTAAANHAWARIHNYELLLYCVTPCVHPDSGELRSIQWCKLVALGHALLVRPRFDTLVYFDTDAFWKVPSVSLYDGLVSRFAPELLTPAAPRVPRSGRHGDAYGESSTASAETSPLSAAAPSAREVAPSLVAAAPSPSAPPDIYFGCNSPWDHCGVRWNFSAPNALSGSAGTGLMLLRNGESTARLLREWWHARHGFARPQNLRRASTCSDQAVLWRMWTMRPDLATKMQILGRPRGHNASASRGYTPGSRAEPGRSEVPSGRRMAHARGSVEPGAGAAILRPRGCMRVASNRHAQRGSPILHLASNVPSYRYAGFARVWNATKGQHDPRWCVTRYALDGPTAAARIYGHVDPWRMLTSRQWFASVAPPPRGSLQAHTSSARVSTRGGARGGGGGERDGSAPPAKTAPNADADAELRAGGGNGTAAHVAAAPARHGWRRRSSPADSGGVEPRRRPAQRSYEPLVCAAGVLRDRADVCCDAACGPVCGGSGCEKLPGGEDRCCAPAILRRGPLCRSAADVACRLP